MSAITPVIFLDRDNTIIHDHGYVHRIEDLRFIDGALQALKLFAEHGIDVFIVTNQGGIAKEIFDLAQLERFHSAMLKEINEHGGKIKDIVFCPHHPESVTEELATPCGCRKPEPGLIKLLAIKWKLDLSLSIMIGDRDSDVEAGNRAGCKSYLFDGKNLNDLANRILDDNPHFKKI